ncbi:MAG: peptide-methionine (R)-S-oxide reductase [Candidatus Parcubacteria bacterium]|jgi:peptide-methionine (R)-S-oxide reductase
MKTDEQLKEENPELYRVAREGGTEAPHSSDLLHIDDDGMFHCAVCDAVLFSSDTKFDSGSGWPSFTDPVDKKAVLLVHDTSHGMRRTEVRCANCDAHLGHVFPDGPERKGDDSRDFGRHDRYCINGVCLNLENE